MPLTDLPLDQCRSYRPPLTEPEDYEAFWRTTLDESADHRGAPSVVEVDTGLGPVVTYDVTLSGYQGQPVRGWLHLPADREGPFPCLVEYLGYGRGRGLPHEKLLWACAGYAHFVMDTRGQGWAGAVGDTADPDPGTAGTVPGFLTRGTDRPENHYYRRLFTDAVHAAEAAKAHPAVDAERVVVGGHSQGGGIALAVSGLVPGLAGVMADVPFLCNFRRGSDIASRGPYTEIAAHLALHRDQGPRVFSTLSYFDAVHAASRATAPALFSVAMMDEVCPPSTSFTAFNAYGGPKEMRVYEFNNHEGGGTLHEREQLAWMRALFANP